jgi:Ca-activated chloride channel family protein
MKNSFKIYIFFTLFLVIAQGFSFGQLTFEKVAHDFEEITEESSPFVDIKITNIGKKKEYFLSVRKPAELQFLTSGQYILPDSSIFFRFQPVLKKSGKFSYTAEIFTSDKDTPTKIQISGSCKMLPENNLAQFQACPDFRAKPAQSATDFKLQIVTLDKATKKPLKQATVFAIQNGKSIGSYATNEAGSVKTKFPMGFSYFYATHAGYKPNEIGAYVNFNRNYIEIELEMDPAQCQPVPRFGNQAVPVVYDTVVPEAEPILVATSTPIAEDIKLEQLLANEQTVTIDSVFTRDYFSIDPANFEHEYFKPIHVVFVLDVSNSMKQEDKFELMKYSLYQLTDYLRPGDLMTVITYSDVAKTLVPTTDGSKKNHIKQPIEKLKPTGFTSGGEGIKLGYKEIKKKFNPEHAQVIIVITDGSFNKKSTDIEPYITENEKLGIELSVVAIKSDEKALENMKSVAALGKGRFIRIDKLVDAQFSLIQEIRIASFKGKK